MVLIVALIFIVVGMIGSAIEAGRQKQRRRISERLQPPPLATFPKYDAARELRNRSERAEDW